MDWAQKQPSASTSTDTTRARGARMLGPQLVLLRPSEHVRVMHTVPSPVKTTSVLPPSVADESGATSVVQ
eukprot:scaffold145477_cov24-Tisochrysis_lutea.AAC.1